MTRDDVARDVERALLALIEKETAATFSYSIVPSKPLGDGGLGAEWTAWHALLIKFRTTYLPKRPAYESWFPDPLLVNDTVDKQLRSTRYQIIKRLWLLVSHS